MKLDVDIYLKTIRNKPGYDLRKRIVLAFVEFLGDREPAPVYVDAFRLHLLEKGYSECYATTAYYIVRSFLKKMGYTFEYPDAPEPPVPKNRPELSYEDVVKMIRCSKKLDERDRALLALSTTYGMRRVEMASLTIDNFDFEKGVLSYRPAKKRKRVEKQHLIPGEIRGVLESYGFPRPLSVRTVSYVFHRICRLAGVDSDRGYGWHSVRRLLDRLLLSRLPEYVVNFYMGWESRSQFVMAEYYATAGSSWMEVDKMVFNKHPFLPIWGEVLKN